MAQQRRNQRRAPQEEPEDDDDDHHPQPQPQPQRQLNPQQPRQRNSRAARRAAPPERRVRLVLSGVRGMAEVLKAAKPTSKHVATVHVAEEGLVLQWEDDAKTMQSSVTFFAQLFSEYERPEGGRDVSFRLPLAQLAEVLGAFAAASSAADDDHSHGGHAWTAAADTAPLIMTYPGPDGELVLELRDEGATSNATTTTTDAPPRRRRCTVLTYARVATLGAGLIGGGGAFGRHNDDDKAPIEGDEDENETEGSPALAMDADWEEPTSYFIAAHQAHMLKEAADDLEWPAAAAGLTSASSGAAGWGRLTLGRDPPTLALSAAVGGASTAGTTTGFGGGERSVEVSVPVDDLAAFCCSGPEVSHAYPLRALRAALGHVPTAPAPALAAAGVGGGGGGGAGGGGGTGAAHHHQQQQQPPPAAAVEYTKVRVDARGLLAVAHMLRMASGGGGGGDGGGGGRGGAAAAMGPTQMAEGRAGGALVQYVVQPLAEEQDDDYAF